MASARLATRRRRSWHENNFWIQFAGLQWTLRERSEKTCFSDWTCSGAKFAMTMKHCCCCNAKKNRLFMLGEGCKQLYIRPAAEVKEAQTSQKTNSMTRAPGVQLSLVGSFSESSKQKFLSMRGFNSWLLSSYSLFDVSWTIFPVDFCNLGASGHVYAFVQFGQVKNSNTEAYEAKAACS